LGAEQTRIWERIAPFWDGLVGDQDDASAWRAPFLGLVDIAPGRTILDVGCGNGRFARMAAAGGAAVVAIDGSRTFIEIARAKTDPAATITYQVVDATDEQQLAALGSRRFDAAAANMVLMNLADVEPLARGLARALKPGGTFVFSVPHPCFPWGDAVTASPDGGGARAHGSLRILNIANALHSRLPAPVRRRVARAALPLLRARHRDYLTPSVRLTSSPGQPTPHYHFYRPLHELLRPFFESGFVLDAVREPANPLSAGAEPIEPEIPNLFVGRLRLASAP
jgi:SAM-dependent methyltransferase